MNDKDKSEQKNKNTNKQVYDTYTYNFIDDSDNRSNCKTRKRDTMNNENKTNSKNMTESTNPNKRVKYNNDSTNKNISKNMSCVHNKQVDADNNTSNVTDTYNVTNNSAYNEIGSSHAYNNNNADDIVTIENRRNPYFTYYYSSAENDEIRINSMRNNGDVRVTRQEYNISNSINRLRETNNTNNRTANNGVQNTMTGNENLDSFFRLQFSFYYPNLNREYLYDVYIENNENDINILSDTNSGINIVNETRHNFAEYTNTRFTERLNESFSTLFSLFQSVLYRNKIKVLSKKDLKKIKLVKYVPKNEKEECSVCIEDFKKNENVRLLDCSHFFHSKCVDKWFLNESNQCPICRKDVLIEEK
ncbi:hypothetical protein BDAP_002038 [Binucleata daphniae]